MKTSELRQKFLKFFETKGHTVVRSSSLVPHDDPTLLFTNAGMNQFKDVFLGFDKRPYSRATTAQKCVRAGGKHNDLENVGYTARHHTFFEMMGNFSFGDYFKRDAIHFAWEFLTSPEWLNIPKDKLLATVYAEDDEAYNIWLNEIGMPSERIVRIGDNKGAKYASDNFWQMGDTGPCGPCSEIFYDHGKEIWGGIPGSPEEDGDRWIEIWNCVFMQFNRDEQGNMNPLPKPSVDTGMGLERMAAVMQHVHSNYEIDLFQDLLKAVARETGAPFSMEEPSLKVIADHIRSCSFLIADGVLPSNEGRGYVLRRIIRRAVRHGYKLGQSKPFFHKLVADLVQEMGGAYPELKEKQAQIEEALKNEESRFAQTLETGMALLENALAKGGKTLGGEIIFKLYDTYGFPYDLTADICRERNIEPDEAGFEREMEAQRARARAAQSFKANAQLPYDGQDTEFKGYSERQTESKVLALYKDGEQVVELNEGDSGAVVIDFTPFYAESGGQVGDVGYIFAGENRFEVRDTQKIKAAVFGQFGVQTSGRLKVGDSITAKVDDEIRNANMRNHSATHLMHKALRDVLGGHVEQKGSLVTAESTRFDISHPQAVTAEEIAEVERRVNEAILANVAVNAAIMSMEDAQKTDAMMLFGEKYGDEVRVLQMGGFSTELCGGTHVSRTGDIGLFKIISEGGIAAGVRRIEAITGLNALKWAQEQERLVKDIIAETKAQTEKDVLAKIQAGAAHAKALEKELARAKAELAVHAGAKLLDDAKDLGAAKLVAAQIEADAAALRETVTDLTGKSDNAVILLAAVNEGKVSLCAGVSKALTGKVKAGDLVKFAAEQVGGKGGGRPDLAQAGGTDADKLPEMLASAEGWLCQKLS
ncbi:alanine--tRNA ligase [Neisseria gonorrhoeae]|uniref:Alanine--tRNA ligase n=1 Tax=Neisseria gonorrhoeae (strain ATCC 700825 / FA 1090) TaxID=242231 RepID=SYA_NEIG1|nr:alanine--tRNA ligase [Neisseria gonorrhoeae]Q5F7C4.1 RecName: Full=Alanine--tRNA ligase; AltName: Full=Alanyl-tRNA synthetase; Short=AlaRS [Neisseria gonorrhoeae FA 1090]AAW89913.1 alanyl-tRNA synthetase [Neisseria gonorrhoeae FA 1090]KAE9493827.1 alanine--tRNA ligase [Neisseria gonorrhoeae]KAE9496445.1 alanine--tRNA ligase [Neisseria gonorrhoeae]KAE9502899.1 alanine--tRNA ligase [Neisseria gonorrhoeae]KAE9504060.1 alanine--tRNA ligase [Neisseria gonorrhoeae]